MFHWLRRRVGIIFDIYRDPIILERDIPTSLGQGFLFCQLRQRRGDQTRYVVLKSKGGDATIYVSLDRSGIDQLTAFLNDAS